MAGLLLAACTNQSSFDSASMAVRNDDTNALASILSRDSSITTNVAPFDGATLLHHAMASLKPGINCARMLLKSGSAPNGRDLTGQTPLHIACRFNASPDAITLLVESGASVNAKDNGGATPLRYARLAASPQPAVEMRLNSYSSANSLKMLRIHGSVSASVPSESKITSRYCIEQS